MRENYLRVGTLVKAVGALRRNYREPNKTLRVAKRKRPYSWSMTYTYFVVGVGDPLGHGLWTVDYQLRALTPLELLAEAAE